MSIVITNIMPPDWPDDQDHAYIVYINRDEICRFVHRRDEGLAKCLMRAAKAVRANDRKPKPPKGFTAEQWQMVCDDASNFS